MQASTVDPTLLLLPLTIIIILLVLSICLARIVMEHLPANVRRLWQLKEGDVLYLRVERGQGTGVVKKAVDPFEVLSDDALEQSRTGKTTTFEFLRSELGVDDE